MFDERTIQELNYYVYALIDPENNEPFYIGKGKGNRVFQHVNGTLENPDTSNEKYDRIRQIQELGNEVKHLILRHGISSEKLAYEIEATVIDFLSYLEYDIKNIVGGHKSTEKGLMTTDEIIRLYNAEKLDSINNDCIIININKTYQRGGGQNSIYEATKATWGIDKRKLMDKNGNKKIKYVLSEYHGLIVEVFEVEEWTQKNRGYNPGAKKYGQQRSGWEFTGKIANDDIRNLYLNKSTAHHKKKGASNSIRFNL